MLWLVYRDITVTRICTALLLSGSAVKMVVTWISFGFGHSALPVISLWRSLSVAESPALLEPLW